MRRRDYSGARKKNWSLYRVRCQHCWRRRTLGKHPDFYTRLPRCCGRTDWWIDWYRTSRVEARHTTCKCIGMPWPHRRSSAWPRLGAACDFVRT